MIELHATKTLPNSMTNPQSILDAAGCSKRPAAFYMLWCRQWVYQSIRETTPCWIVQSTGFTRHHEQVQTDRTLTSHHLLKSGSMAAHQHASGRLFGDNRFSALTTIHGLDTVGSASGGATVSELGPLIQILCRTLSAAAR